MHLVLVLLLREHLHLLLLLIARVVVRLQVLERTRKERLWWW